MDRRTTIKWVLAASAAWPQIGEHAARAESTPTPQPAAQGYGMDPNLLTNYRPGELWPLTLTAPQRRLAGVLADIIIPADDHSPSASAVGVVEFIDEWVSAPYPNQQRDRAIVLDGFAWLDAEAARRFGKEFADLDSTQHRGICDDICSESRATAERRGAARFFALYRDLTGGGFYSSPAGRKDLNFIGNVPQTSFEGPPAALLKALGLME
jgi:Gluconate 2-dehydrogenase subunit 3